MIKLRGNIITWILAGIILFINIPLLIFGFVSGAGAVAPFYFTFGFVPAIFLSEPFAPFSLLSLITYFFLHGGWLHLGLNTAMLLALGTGVERHFGVKWLLLGLAASSLASIFLHLVFYPQSTDPVIGASGGISGLLAIVLVNMMGQDSPKRILTLVLLFVAISAVFGFMGGPGGENIAWVAHIGGFAGGLAVAFILYRSRNSVPRSPAQQRNHRQQASAVVLPFQKKPAQPDSPAGDPAAAQKPDEPN